MNATKCRQPTLDVTLVDLDRRLDALQTVASTLICALRDLVQAQKNTNDAVRLLADNLRAEVNAALGIKS